jgi:dienelactone hydrolase
MSAITCQIATDIQRPIDLEVRIPAHDVELEGDWSIPRRPRGVIILATGAGNARFNRRNRQAAREMYDAGYATLLLDLLTPLEEKEDQLTGAFQVDVKLMTARLVAATEWVRDRSALGDLPRGYFMSGVAAAAALSASAANPGLVDAVVSRGGRPDLAGTSLTRVVIPVLLIVGGEDTAVFGMNRWALRRLNSIKKIVVIPGASHLFHENGSLGVVCRLARSWFDSHLRLESAATFSHQLVEGSQWHSAPELVP